VNIKELESELNETLNGFLLEKGPQKSSDIVDTVADLLYSTIYAHVVYQPTRKDLLDSLEVLRSLPDRFKKNLESLTAVIVLPSANDRDKPI
jgi:hypothetical protein